MDSDLDSAAKRKRRDKYVRKACAECKRRKIKCDGESPCAHCQTISTRCEYFEGKTRGGARRTGPATESHDEYADDVHIRLHAVEEKLELFAARYPLNDGTPKAYVASPASSIFHNIGNSTSSQNGNSLPKNGGWSARGASTPRTVERFDGTSSINLSKSGVTSAFYGQSSSTGNLSNMRDQLHTIVPGGFMQAESKIRRSPEPLFESDTPMTANLDLERPVPEFQIPGREHTHEIFRVMFEDMISMYPMLHPPTFYKRYACLWDDAGNYRPEVLRSSAFKTSEVGLLLACLAAGGMMQDSQGLAISQEEISSDTRRWFVAAKRMILDYKLETITDLESIQAMVIMCLYYLFVENEDAAYKLIGLTARSAFEIGLHLAACERDLSGAEIEHRRRTWWIIYLVDRRTSMLLGRPFCIQDHDSDVLYPAPLDDLHEFPYQLEVPIRLEISKIPFLMHFVGFSSICGEIYSKIYRVKCQWPPDERMVMALDAKLEQWQFSLPSFLRFDQKNIHTTPKWLAKQQFFLHLRGAHIRLLLLRPFVSEPEAISLSHPSMAASAQRLSSDVIHIISVVKRTSDLIERLWFPSKQIVLTCIGIIFWVVLNFPTKFNANSSKVDLRVALQLLKEFYDKSSLPPNRSSLRDIQFLRYLCNQALKAQNQRPIESATQSPSFAQEPMLQTVSDPYLYAGQGDLSFLAQPDLARDDLLLGLLDTGDAAILPTSEEFLMMGDDYSRYTMLSM